MFLRQRKWGSLLLLLAAGLAEILLAGGAAAQTMVEGYVRDQAGNPVPGARVSLLRRMANESGAEREAQSSRLTDAVGRFEFAGVDAGDYAITADAEGYFQGKIEFLLRSRQPLSLTLELARKQTLTERVETRAGYLSLDPEKTGSSYTFSSRDLDKLPDPLVETTSALVLNLMPGASDSHDNFLAVRGTEFSLHEFLNGVSFLDNTQPQFSPGVSPQIFETVDLLTGGFAPEYGNRFGGVLDITTKSGASLGGRGSLNFRAAQRDTYDLNADYGGETHGLGYYFFADGFRSGRFLDPPEPMELFDTGMGSRAMAQLDWRAGAKDAFKLLFMGAEAHFEQPNLTEDQMVGRDARRRLGQETAIFGWQHAFSANTLLAASLYGRSSGDRVLPTSDPVTPLSVASRSGLTLGVKADLSHVWRSHYLKTGVDLVRLRELESFFFDGRGDPDVFPPFQGGVSGGQASLYAQDHFSPLHNLTLDLGLRYDRFDLIDTHVQLSPRVGLAWHLTRTKSVLHAAYNRLFSPPPIEYSLLASFLGHNAIDPAQRVGDARPYTQNYYEAGWSQELFPKLTMELNAYVHTGDNAFENHEISITRVFVPINFHTGRSRGVEFVARARQLERLGITARFQYALAKTFFVGPVTGGFAGNEPLLPGERITPAFHQTHTGAAHVFYSNRWRDSRAGAAMRYGSGTIIENGPRLASHFTADLSAGVNLWSAEKRALDIEFVLTNVSNRVYQIAKESEEIPIQYSQPRTAGGSLKFRF